MINQTFHSILELMDWWGRQMLHYLRYAQVPSAVKEKGEWGEEPLTSIKYHERASWKKWYLRWVPKIECFSTSALYKHFRLDNFL